jgi:type IV pilus assembly protein PilW
MRKQQGLSLIELMISITIGLVLMTGVVQMFLSSRTVFTTQQAISRVQESGRMAMEFMGRDIRMAGFMGCMSRNIAMTNTLNNSSDFLYNFDVGIEGATAPNGAGDPALPAGYPAAALPGTDVLVMRSASGSGMGVAQNNNSSQLFGVFDTEDPAGSCSTGDGYNGVCIGDILVVSDCQKARVFQVTNLTPTADNARLNVVHSTGSNPGNAITSWGGASKPPEERFGTDSEIIKISTMSYYIAEGSSGRPSLWQKADNQAAQELLEGVESMRLIYGRDTTGDRIPDTYDTATGVAGNWDSVAGVRVQLLIASVEDGVVAEPQPYTFNGALVTPTDRRLRQVFINTIAIRSRLP